MEISMQVPQNIKNRSPILSSHTTSGYIPKRKSAYYRCMYILMVIGVLFITVKLFNQPRYPLRNEWLKKM
jgi:hypothetical protein